MSLSLSCMRPYANEPETLFFALMVISHADSVAELNTWADKVKLDTPRAMALREKWRPSEEGEHGWPLRKGPGKVSTLFDRRPVCPKPEQRMLSVKLRLAASKCYKKGERQSMLQKQRPNGSEMHAWQRSA
mmetsp:Transcript_2944/g.6283  ORF Transcript_2944/g.6283 Transcript_2944/m.6283 type:complete len:131 (+) Transcript_2944:556-948(+)